MNFDTAVAILCPEISKWTRDERMDAIASAIRGVNCDALEARDLIGVVIDTMKYRFDESELSDIHHEFRQLVEALEEFQYEQSLKEKDD